MCDFCKNFDWGGASAKTDEGYESRVTLALGSYRFPVNEQFTFCPVCGRPNQNKVQELNIETLREPRYIDATLALENLARSTVFTIAKNTPEIDAVVVRVTYGYIKEFLDKIPADEDVIKVVRCKDCKHWVRNTGVSDNQPNGHCFYHIETTNGYDYCSYGELKEREQ